MLLRACTGKHHRAYVDNMNKQIAGTDLEGKSLEEIVLASWNKGTPTPVFNNAAQVCTTHHDSSPF
jgi:Fe-Mn family superoxide dismutase